MPSYGAARRFCLPFADRLRAHFPVAGHLFQIGPVMSQVHNAISTLTDSEACIIAHRLPEGRYGSGMDLIWKHFGKKRLWTSRNFNTVIKAAQ